MPAGAVEDGNDISVRVDIEGDVVRTNVELSIAATPREVWDVLTDFEHIAQFISNIGSSKVLSRDGNIVRVAQAGRTSFGPLSFEFQSEREITLTPYERFDSRMVRGNMKRFRGTTKLGEIDGRTRLRYQSEAVPDTALPLAMARSLIESETREHYREIRKEVLRRKADTRSP